MAFGPGGLPPRRALMVGPKFKEKYNLRRRGPRPADPTIPDRSPSPVPTPSSSVDEPVAARLRRRRPADAVVAQVVVPPIAATARRRPRRVVSPGPLPGPSASGAPPGAPPGAGLPAPDRRPNNFACPECPQSFPTAIGLGQHRRHAHKEAYNRGINVERVRRGWNEEELHLLAREEAIATRRGVRFLNQHLLTIVPNRTIDSIKGARRGAAYKALVEEFLRALSESVSSTDDSVDDYQSAEEENAIASVPSQSIPSVPLPIERPSVEAGYPAPGQLIPRLLDVVDNIRGWNTLVLARLARECLAGGADVTAGVSQWLDSTFPAINAFGVTPHPVQARIVNPSRKVRRRQEYARIQRMFRKDMSRAAKEILDGAGHEGDVPETAVMAAYWGPLVSEPSVEILLPRDHLATPRADLAFVWAAVTIEEVTSSGVPLNAAPGLDGITPRMWRAVPASVKALLFNILLVTGSLPSSLLSSRTVFIPKKVEHPTPADFRPISITSVIVRHFHRILARRLLSAGLVDLRQRCFDDGCAENVAVLSTILQDARRRLKEVHVASLDVSKAFDNVSHSAVDDVLLRLGLPDGFRRYVRTLYQQSVTTFEVRGHRSEVFPIRRGVRQGDPLSPVLFCLVIDRVLGTIPRGIGYTVGEERVDCIVFADDALLFATTKWGLQSALDHVEEEAAACGLSLNVSKSSVLSIVPSGREKKSKVVTERTFRLRSGAFLPQLEATSNWRYLGTDFSPMGSRYVRQDLRAYLDSITRAPLKPQQRLKILRCFLLPRLYHSMVLGRVTQGSLRKMDLETRGAVRRWLRLPHDVAVGCFHASVRDGGLGIPSMATTVPGLVLDRFQRLGQSSSPAARACAGLPWVQERLRWAGTCLSRGEFDLTTEYRRRQWWSMRLHSSVDGWELRECPKTNLSSHWIDAGSLAVPGKDFVQFTRVWTNCLPSLVRTTRGVRRAQRDVRCRAGCGVDETAAHIVQSCHRTHGGRVRRHDAVANTVAAALRDKGWTVIQEPLLDTREGRRKPDVVGTKDGNVCVIDAQIVSGATSLDEAHDRKVGYYAGNEDLMPAINSRLGRRANAPEATFLSSTLSWRGVWSHKSADGLLRLGLTRALLRGITTRVLQGSHTNFSRWNKMTTMASPAARDREGVG